MHNRGEIGLTALKVVPGINALVSLGNELRASKDSTSGITTIAHNVFLPLVGVTLVRALAGTGGVRPTLSGTFLEGWPADTLSIRGRVTVRAGEVTGVAPGTNRGRVVGVSATGATLPCRYLRTTMTVNTRSDQRCEGWWMTHEAGNVVRDFWSANDRGSRVENGIGVAKARNSRKTCTHAYQQVSTEREKRRIHEGELTDTPKCDRLPIDWVGELNRDLDVVASVQPSSLLVGRVGEGLGTGEQDY